MKTNTSLAFRLAPIAAALLATFGPVHAAEGDLRSKITADSSIEIGGGYVDQDNGNFGKYNGLNEEGGYLLLDGDVKTRDDLSGTWTRLRARNLGLDTRELRWDHTRQGNWGYYLEYNEIPRNEPLQVITPVVGIGGPNLTCVGASDPGCPGAVSVPVDFESKRKRYSLGFDKMFGSKWGFKVDFRNEEKKGERIFGVGYPEFNFVPEPFDSTIRLLDATVRFSEKNLQLTGGYYGTQYRNDFSALSWTYGLMGSNSTIPIDILSPLALPPDNQSHQLYVAGGYSFNPTTRGTFKVAYTEATQDDTFIVPSTVGRADLGGKIETTLLQAGVSARPIPKLSIIGNLRYEDRDDKTPIAQYATATGTTDGTNEPRSFKNTYGKLEASYALPQGFRGIGWLEYDKKERNTYPIRSVSHRDETVEWSYRAELRRAMSETATGAISYTYSDRDGSDFYTNTTVTGTLGSNDFAPLHYADRKRDKVRLSLNWMPVTPLSVQVYVDDISDRYEGNRDPAVLVGPRKGEQQVYAIDVAYQFNKNWQATAWYNYNEYKFENSLPDHSAISTNKGNSFGVGVRGKPTGRVEVGADFSYSDIEDEWAQPLIPPGTVPSGGILPPSATTRLTRLKLFGKYILDKNSGLRLDYIFDRYSTNDPTWTYWGAPGSFGRYFEGTMVSEPSPQVVHFVGVRYFYNFQ